MYHQEDHVSLNYILFSKMKLCLIHAPHCRTIMLIDGASMVALQLGSCPCISSVEQDVSNRWGHESVDVTFPYYK